MLKLLFTGTCISSENIMLSFFFLFSDHLEVLFYLPVSRCLTSLDQEIWGCNISSLLHFLFDWN